MSLICSDGVCVNRVNLCIPRGNDKAFTFSVYDKNGDEFDISGATEIVFIIAEGANVGGNLEPGGTVYVEKRLTDGDIQISTNGYMFSLTVTEAESDTFPRVVLYCEAEITNSAGEKTTLIKGIVTSTNTMIRSL